MSSTPTDNKLHDSSAPSSALRTQGRLHCHIQIANEASLRIHQKAALEVHVTDIISRLSEVVQDPHEFELGQGIIFENDANSLSDLAEEVKERMILEPPRTPPSASAVPPSDASNLETTMDSGAGRTRADQYCIYRQLRWRTRITIRCRIQTASQTLYRRPFDGILGDGFEEGSY